MLKHTTSTTEPTVTRSPHTIYSRVASSEFLRGSINFGAKKIHWLPRKEDVWHAVSNKNQFKLVSFNPGFYHSIQVSIIQSRFLSYNPGFYHTIRVPIFQSGFLSRLLSFNPGFYLYPVSYLLFETVLNLTGHRINIFCATSHSSIPIPSLV